VLIVAESQDGRSRLTGLNLHSGQRTFIADLQHDEPEFTLDCSRAYAYLTGPQKRFELRRIRMTDGQTQSLIEPDGLDGQITDMAVSQSGQSLAVCLMDTNAQSSLYVYDIEDTDDAFRINLRIGNQALESQRYHAPVFLGSDTRLLVQLEHANNASQLGLIIPGRTGAADSVAPRSKQAGRFELIETPYRFDTDQRPVTDLSGTQVWLMGSSASDGRQLLRLDVPSRTAAPIHGAPGGSVICSRNGTENALLFGTQNGLYQVTEHTANLVCELDSRERLLDIISDDSADSWIYLVRTQKGMEYRNIDLLAGSHSILLRFQTDAEIRLLGFVSEQILSESSYSRLEPLLLVDEIGTAISLDATENKGGQSSLNDGVHAQSLGRFETSNEGDELFAKSSDQTDIQDGFESVFTPNRTTAERLSQARLALLGPPDQSLGSTQSLNAQSEATVDEPFEGENDEAYRHETNRLAADIATAHGDGHDGVTGQDTSRPPFVDKIKTIVDKAGAARFSELSIANDNRTSDADERVQDPAFEDSAHKKDHFSEMNAMVSTDPDHGHTARTKAGPRQDESATHRSEWTAGMADKEDDVWTSAPAAIKPEAMALGRADPLFPVPTHRDLRTLQSIQDAEIAAPVARLTPDVDFALWMDGVSGSPSCLEGLAELNAFVKDQIVGIVATQYFKAKLDEFEAGGRDGNGLILAISAVGHLKPVTAREQLVALCDQAYRRIKSSGGLPEAHEHFAMAAVRALSSKRGRFSAPAVFDEYDSVIAQTEKILAHEGEKRARRFIGAVSKKYRFALAKLIGKPESEGPSDQRASRPDADQAELDRLSRIEELMQTYEFPDSLMHDESMDDPVEPAAGEPFNPLTAIPSMPQPESTVQDPQSSEDSMEQFSVQAGTGSGHDSELSEGFRAHLSVPASGGVRSILTLGGVVAFVAGLALAILGFRLGLAPSIAGLILCFGGVGLLGGRRRGWLLGLFGYLTTGFVLISFPYLKPLPPDVLPAGLQVMGGLSLVIAVLLSNRKIRVHLGRLGIDPDVDWDE